MNAIQTRSTDDLVPAYEAKLEERGPIAQNGRLVPADYCRAIVEAPEPPKCGLEAGARLAAMLIGSYPRQKVNDPKTYALALTTVFSKFPEATGRAAIDDVICHKSFFPAPADVYGACSKISGAAAIRRNRAREILAEHVRRGLEEKRLARVRADHDKIMAKIRKHGSPAARLAAEWAERDQQEIEKASETATAKPTPKKKPKANPAPAT